jgi:hypothetical protein
MMSFGEYFYQIEFNDGRIIRRKHMTKKDAQAVAHAMSIEMILFDVKSVTWGVMN